jgi:hypothetical protein
MALHDYPAELPNRVMLPRGNTGPSTLPIQKGSSGAQKPEALLNGILTALKALPSAQALEFRTRFQVVPREAVPVLATSAPVTIAAAATSDVISYAVPEKFGGFLTGLGIMCSPETAMVDIAWSLQIGNNVAQNFDQVVFNANFMSPPLPFPQEICSGKTVKLTATNNSAGPLQVAGLLVGWVEFLSNFKTYGTIPSSGQ